jgi:hypothetical protein
MGRGKINETVIGYKIYNEANELLGTAEVELPNVTFMTEEISGAGINGKLESVIMGYIETMSTTINWRTMEPNAVELSAPEFHQIIIKSAVQKTDLSNLKTTISQHKYILAVKPKTFNTGKITSGATSDVNIEFSVSYYKVYIDGVKQIEIDPINYICEINGRDYLKEVREALD